MVEIYNDTCAVETDSKGRPFNFTRLLLVSLGAALMLSLVASFNLSKDVNYLTNEKVPQLQTHIAANSSAIEQDAARIHRANAM